MPLRLPREIKETIQTHGETSYPEECCGFLLGGAAKGGKAVSEIRPAGNRREDSPRNRYSIAPEEFLLADREGRSRGLEIVGFYHSHPDHPAVPSEYDREHAWPWYSYVIVPVAAGRAGAARSWVLEDRGRVFEEEPLEEEKEEKEEEREPCRPGS